MINKLVKLINIRKKTNSRNERIQLEDTVVQSQLETVSEYELQRL